MNSKPPFIGQESPETCALACLRMLLAHHGCNATESELRAICDVTEHGTHIEELCRVARQVGFAARIEEAIDIADLEHHHARGLFPIVYLNRQPIDGELSTHSVVIVRVTPRFVVFLDPLRGERRCSRKKFLQAWGMLNRLALICDAS